MKNILFLLCQVITFTIYADSSPLLLSRDLVSLTPSTTQTVSITNTSNQVLQLSIPAGLSWDCPSPALDPQQSCFISVSYNPTDACKVTQYPITSVLKGQKIIVNLSANNVCATAEPYVIPINNQLPTDINSYYFDVIAGNLAKVSITNASFSQTEGEGLSLGDAPLPTECSELANFGNTCRIEMNETDNASGAGVITLKGNFVGGQYQVGVYLPKALLSATSPFLILQPSTESSVTITEMQETEMPIDLPKITVTGDLNGKVVIDNSQCQTIDSSCLIKLIPLDTLQVGMQGNLVISSPLIEKGSFSLPVSTAGALSIIPMPKFVSTSLSYQQVMVQNTSSFPIVLQNITLPSFSNLTLATSDPYSTTCKNGMTFLPTQTCTLWFSATNNQTLGLQTGKVDVAYLMDGITQHTDLNLTIKTDLFALGNFSMAGGHIANFIATWNGNNWDTLGYGLLKNMQSNIADDGLAGLSLYYDPYDGNLYIGGEFYTYQLVAWNGYTWFSLGYLPSEGGSVYSLVDNGSGIYYVTGAIGARNVYEYNKEQGWSVVGDGIPGLNSVLTSVYENGNLYVGGNFITDTNAKNLAMWNGNTWTALGEGVDGNVNQLIMDNNILYAVGDFSLPNQVSTNIATFDGQSWTTFQGGTNGVVNTILINKNLIYIGGAFSQAGTTHINNLALWDGHQWNALGQGVDPYGEIKVLAMDGAGNLYVAGRFKTVAGVRTWNIAMWDGKAWNTLKNGVNGTIYSLAIAPTLTVSI